MLAYNLITLEDIQNVTKVQAHALAGNKMWYIHKDHSCQELNQILTGEMDTPDHWIFVRYANRYRETIATIVHDTFHVVGTEIETDSDEDSTTSDEEEEIIGRCVCGHPVPPPDV